MLLESYGNLAGDYRIYMEIEIRNEISTAEMKFSLEKMHYNMSNCSINNLYRFHLDWVSWIQFFFKNSEGSLSYGDLRVAIDPPPLFQLTSRWGQLQHLEPLRFLTIVNLNLNIFQTKNMEKIAE